MKRILLMIAAVALVGCGKKTTPSEPVTNAGPKVAANKPEPAKGGPKAAGKKPTPPKVLVNALGGVGLVVPHATTAHIKRKYRMRQSYASRHACSRTDAGEVIGQSQ